MSPEAIMRLASGFMAAKHLFAANELGLFEALGDSPATIDALAARTGLTTRAARISADAIAALGLVERDGDVYRNSPVAAMFLSGQGPGDLRPFLRFWDKISYPTWEHLAGALASGPPKEIFELDNEQQGVASAGIEAILMGPASALAQTVDFSEHRRLLDVGGGTGSWSVVACRAHDQLQATVLELPVVAEVARKRVAATGMTERIDVVEGDAMNSELPSGYDLFLVANLAHYWSPEENRQLLHRIRRAAEPGAHLLLADFWTDPSHTQPVIAALMAGRVRRPPAQRRRLQRRGDHRLARRNRLALPRARPPGRPRQPRHRRSQALMRSTQPTEAALREAADQAREVGAAGVEPATSRL